MIDFLLRRLPLGAIVLLVLPFGVPSAHAASDPQSLVGVWRLTVQDKNPNRELEVLNVGVVPGGCWRQGTAGGEAA